ncbi:hypothetical protein BFV94_4312 [Alteromonas macleodii]|uniref:Uncharacterized protein n=2 Tax=Alteromonas macleodii TaxID=28108 RepID=A0AB36FP31_ALTMA|nr:hypothetical protein BFV93_4700 [Alteromonas macleodii]OES25786.1 hypothetical protein BFV94_4312 [Alteromonas macleodii]OES25867.1 hypothetical protein BFV95_4255 [Alteromonas macleodii]OES38968.1 hypothetical protein BFV96_4462 [Alteromonas macleodii]
MQNSQANTSKSKPTHTASVKIVDGSYTRFDRVGVAWLNDDGKMTFRPYGTQIISGDIYLNPVKEQEEQQPQ